MSFLKKLGGFLGSAVNSTIAGPLVSGVTGLLGSSSADRRAEKENQKNREWNLMLAEKANQWNIEQWNRENAYNSPTQQKERLLSAGLNPSLIGGASSGNASSMSMNMSAPSSPTDFSVGSQMRLQALQQLSQAGLTAAQTSVARAEARKKEAEAKQEEENVRQIEQLKHFFETGTTLDKILEGVTGDVLTSRRLIQIQKEYYEAQNMNFVAKNNYFASIKQRIESEEWDKKFKSELDEISSRTSLTRAQIKEITSLLAAKLLGINIDNKIKQTDLDFLTAEKATALGSDFGKILVMLIRAFRGRK